MYKKFATKIFVFNIIFFIFLTTKITYSQQGFKHYSKPNIYLEETKIDSSKFNELLQIDLNIDSTYKSKNFNSRINYIVLHFTGCPDLDSSLNILLGINKDYEVSAHYLINDIQTKKYPNFIYRLVDENNKSWHAGVSAWSGNNNLNFSSIGIENQNMDGNIYEFNENQVSEIIKLCQYLKIKYNISDINFIGHSDIAFDRKEDPGTKFPWKKLYENGIGAWYNNNDIDSLKQIVKILPIKDTILKKLQQYGYTPTGPLTKSDDLNNKECFLEYTKMVSAFQRHFIQSKVDGIMNLEDYITLLALLKKYRK